MPNAERCKDLSVIISVYNYKLPQNLRAVIKSIQNQNIDIEIILSEQGNFKESNLKKIADEFNVKYISSKPDIIDGKEFYNIGRVRNIGAIMSSGKYLYFNDADILVYNNVYFSTIIEKSLLENKFNWYRPSMYRLSEDTTDDFLNDYLDGKIKNIPLLNNVCMVDYEKKLNIIKPIQEGECNDVLNFQPHVCKKSEFDMNANNKDFDYTKIGEYIWKPSFHYGGTFCSYENFIQAAGFCESYYNWGLEDEDFHWKLKSRSGIEQIDSIVSSNSIIHFEHCRRCDIQTYKNNRDVFEQRKNKGINEVIEIDRNTENSFIGAFLRKDTVTIRGFFEEDIGFDKV